MSIDSPSRSSPIGAKAIVDNLQTQLAAAPSGRDVVDLPLAEGLRILGRATASAALSERAIVLMRLAVGEHSRFPELARLLFDLAPQRSYERFVAYLEAKQARGEVEIEDFQIAAEQFFGGLVGHQQLRLLLGVEGAPPEAIERRVEAAVRMFLRTYGK